MELIPLTQGQFAKVDSRDYRFLMQWKWRAKWNPKSKTFYAVRRQRGADGKLHLVHRFIKNAARGVDVDHRDHDGLNNRRRNLRPASNSQNQMNSDKHSNNTSGYKGAHWHKRMCKWEAEISVDGRRLFLGYFDTAHKAGLAYKAAAKQYHGEFRYKLEGR